MNKNLLSIGFFIFIMHTLSAQTNIQFFYDNAGNRIQRGLTVVVQVVSNAEEVNWDNMRINVFPNPVEDILYIECHSSEKEERLSAVLYDSSGRQVISNNLQGAVTAMDITSLPAGIYWLALVNGRKPVKQFQVVKK